ncbi:hypothetical protein [Pedobacter sp. MW01-1-1]|uniref:hypothetical protein n=1 Tax=Pedobacter sp. MW01-1-1 TaxID=3383027 RepID=UPI003FF01A18
MDPLEISVNKSWDKAMFVRLISAFAPEADYMSFLDMTDDIYKFFKTSTDNEISNRLKEINDQLDRYVYEFSKIYPPLLPISEIAANWSLLLNDGGEIYSYGINYGWLEGIFDLRNFRLYNYVPFQFRLGIGVHKRHFAIEEEGLLKDAFNMLAKSARNYKIMQMYGQQQTEKLSKIGEKEFDPKTYTKLTDQKYEVSSYSRLTIVSFYAFVEAFVNSIGFSYLKRNESTLSEDQKEVLLGKKKGRYLMLRSKMELFQKIIRTDKRAVLILSDEIQMPECAKSFFSDYEELRNAAVHYSPIKTNIWLKNKDWVQKAEDFSKISIELSLNLWNSCYPNIGSPEYLGELNYNLHLKNANERLDPIEDITKGLRE